LLLGLPCPHFQPLTLRFVPVSLPVRMFEFAGIHTMRKQLAGLTEPTQQNKPNPFQTVNNMTLTQRSHTARKQAALT